MLIATRRASRNAQQPWWRSPRTAGISSWRFRAAVLQRLPVSGRRASNRVNRGGSWNNNARNCRAANRNRNTPSNRNNNLGFRVALAPRGVDARRTEQAAFPSRCPSMLRTNLTLRRPVLVASANALDGPSITTVRIDQGQVPFPFPARRGATLSHRHVAITIIGRPTTRPVVCCSRARHATPGLCLSWNALPTAQARLHSYNAIVARNQEARMAPQRGSFLSSEP